MDVDVDVLRAQADEDGRKADGGRRADGFALLDGPTQIPLAKRGQRSCPVPKPSGLVGEILGFNDHHLSSPNQNQDQDQSKKESCPIPPSAVMVGELLGFKRVGHHHHHHQPSSSPGERERGRRGDVDVGRPP